jgi:monoamine oxidase
LEGLCFEIDLNAPHIHPRALEWDSVTCQRWIQDNAKLESTKSLVEWFILVCLAQNTSEVSFLFFLTWLRSSGGYKNLVNIHGGAQEGYIKGGTQQISKLIVEEIGSERVILSCPVVKIKQDEKEVLVTYEHKSKYFKVIAKHCIVAVPPNLIPRIRFDPLLPSLKDQLCQRSPAGVVIKIHIVYEKAFWKENGFSGEFITDKGPLGIGYDKSHDGLNCIVAFIAGQEARKWSQVNEEDRRKAVLKQLSGFFDCKEALYPLIYIEKDWSQEEFCRGCYFSSMTPGTMVECGKYLKNQIGRIHFGASETANQNMGYLDGAMDAGIRCATEVIGDIKKSKL